jgi:hypothetical protein
MIRDEILTAMEIAVELRCSKAHIYNTIARNRQRLRVTKPGASRQDVIRAGQSAGQRRRACAPAVADALGIPESGGPHHVSESSSLGSVLEDHEETNED